MSAQWQNMIVKLVQVSCLFVQSEYFKMLRVSEKQKLLKLLEVAALNDLMIVDNFCEDEEEKTIKEYYILEELLVVLALGEECRYSVPYIQNSVPKCKEFLNDVLWELDETRFKKITRLNWKTFDFILNLIKDDASFNQIRSCKQFPLKTQLAIVLYRLGSNGEGATLSKIAGLFGVSDGGIIQNLTDRIFKALLKHKDQYLFWPNSDERKKLVPETWGELPNCVGYVDGIEIPLAEKPSQDPEAYFSRKHQYSVKVQAVCDHSLQIRHLVLGYPGSVHDARIFGNCELSNDTDVFFGGAEWIACGSAYKLSRTVITPFRENSRELTQRQRTFFNKIFSRYRIRNEHCYGMLMERFGSLKTLRLQIKDEKGMNRVEDYLLRVVAQYYTPT
ncbi:uncharacterized protein LOC126767356 [Bactrocera neohumeralis]|uniref:uncharacterized protein LOC126767356 n=1 Tax=Bactrocera neohumeralis TaxID=98809 RepID=UPI00216679E9|nr:uncharacterized protein LOC126767356 [Bactrocera neohumeralis]